MQGATRYALRDAYRISEREAEFYIRVAHQHQCTERLMIVADFHFPRHDTIAVKRLYLRVEEFHPDIFIVLGDLCNHYSLSPWKKDPTYPRFPEELDMTRGEIRTLSQVTSFCQRRILIPGNHDFWLAQFLAERNQDLARLPELAYREIYKLDELGWEYIETGDRIQHSYAPFKIWNLYTAHGDEDRIGVRSINLARNHYLRNFCNAVFAHHHRTDEFVVRKMDGSYTHCYSIGCMCELSPSFCLLNPWNNGWLEAERQGECEAYHNRRLFPGGVLV